MDSEHRLTIDNREVFYFYKQHGLDFEEMNILFMNILNKLFSGKDSSSALSSLLLDKFNALDGKIELIAKSHTDVASAIELKLNESRKEYNDNMKQIIVMNNVEHIAPLVKENNSMLLDRTSLIMNELMPKNNDAMTKDIQNHIQSLHTTITNETNKIITSSIDKKAIDEMIDNVTKTIGIYQASTLSHLTTHLTSSESRIENKLVEAQRKINEIKEMSSANISSSQLLQTNVTDMLKKFEKSNTKGAVSECVVYNILLSLFPCAQVDHVGGEQKETGDIMIIRDDKPKILIENKDHASCNVPRSDVDKFIRDCEIQNCSGIMFAQHRGISNKKNFELNINNGNVLLYVHEVNFDREKIKMAIDVVEHFKTKLDETFNNDADCVIDKDVLIEINRDFTNYVSQKHNMMKLLKDFTDKMGSSINELKLPALEKYLSSKFATSSSAQINNVCKYCEKAVNKSILQHYRYCQAKKDFDEKENSNTTV